MSEPAKTNPAEADGAGADEFAHIPRRRIRHPFFALAGAVLAFFLVFHIRHELRYALSSGDVLDLGNARVTFGGEAAPPALRGLANRYVRVAGTPDRESALEIDTKGSWKFTELFRVLGTENRLFLHRPDGPLPAALAENDVFQGRLIRFDELTFASAIRGYFSQRVTATHYFAPETFVAALAARRDATAPLRLVDRAGDAVTLAPGQIVAVDVVRRDEVRLGLPRSRFPGEAEARAAIESRGGEVRSSAGLVKAAAAPTSSALGASTTPPERWTFVARFPPERRDAALAALGDIDRLVEIRDARENVTGKVSDLAAAGEGIVVRGEAGGERRLTSPEIAAVHTPEPVVIPAEAYLLVEGDHPRRHLANVFVALVLVGFGAFNLAGFVRGMRRPGGRP